MLGIAKGLTAFASNVLMVDFYGSGGSSGTGTTLGIDESYDVQAAVDFVRARWPGQKVLLYGQSMGGATILRAVAKLSVAPEAIVLDCSFGRLLATVESRFRNRMGLPAFPLAELLVLWGSVRIGRNGFAHEPVEYARAVRCPTLVLQGVNDPNITPEEAREMAGNLGGWKRISEYVKAGHSDLRSSQPEQWKQDVGLLMAELRREP
jgi:pimeloyl-ACP methyl ester carboxylesterase